MRDNAREPGYIALYRSGELERRVCSLEGRLASCDLCPRECLANRVEDKMAHCHSGYLPAVAAVCAHFGEEPPISGSRGSGTIFFGNCNLRCVYCQNYQISQDRRRQRTREMDCQALARQMLYLQDKLGCHNINFVTPSHFVPQLARAVLHAVPLGLRIPLVYNTSAYDSLSTLREMEGIIDIYLPDLRYASEAWALKLSGASDYVARAREAIREMYRQVGNLEIDEFGVARHGVIVRHLILPNGLAGSRESLTWLALELSPTVAVSIMAQYLPLNHAPEISALARKVSLPEYEEVLDLLSCLGLENGWAQDPEAADTYVPDFEWGGHPFAAL